MSNLLTSEKRKQQLETELLRLVESIQHKYKPEKIIAFGSFVNGPIHEWSDLDLAIIKNTNKHFIDRLIEVAHLIDNKLATDFVVYTPREFTEMARDNYFVREEIIGKGRVIYDKNKFS